MITLPRNFFRDAHRDAMALATPEGACWINGDIWLLAGSSLNPAGRRHTLLASCYDDMHPLAPPADAIDAIVLNLSKVVPAAEWETFRMRATILRAAVQACLNP